MGSKQEDVSGLNSRFDSKRNKGFNGARGYNIFPRQDEESWVAADPAGNYNSSAKLAGTVVAQIKIQVTQAFDGAATIIVGSPADPDQFVTLADAVNLAVVDTTVIAAPAATAILAATSVFRATIGGAPTQGAAIITADFEV